MGSSIETKGAKLSFNPEKIPEIPVIDSSIKLTDELSKRADSFPLLNNGELSIIGQPGSTGVVVITSHNGFENVVVASLPHPRTRLKEIKNEEVFFGGLPPSQSLESALEKPIGMEKAQKQARLLLTGLKQCSNFAEFSEMFNGMGAIGSEPEAWVINPESGDLTNISGGELQAGLLEETLEAISDPQDFLIKRAKHVLDRNNRFPNSLIIDTSVLPTSNILSPKVNTGHELGAYVLAVQRFLWENYFSFSTPEAVEIMNQLVRHVGFNNIQELHQNFGHMAYWVMAASHASVGLHHLRTGNKAMWVPTEWAIAVADIFNSDLATVTEFLMYSTPLIFGQTPTLKIEGQELWPNDYRAILRYLMDTTNPGQFIENPEQMHQRIIYAITNGLTHTMDRASYLTKVNDKLIPVAHGRVRNRIASSEPRNLTGRIEFTGCSASPSIIDEVARNCFLQILMVGAMEAVTNGQMPQEYFNNNFPSIASWQNQKDLAIKTSLFGFHYPPAENLINEALEFIETVYSHYPALKLQAQIATARIKNLLADSVGTLEEYLENPQGPISEVLKNEISNGVNPLDFAQRIHNYQLLLAQKLLINPLFWLQSNV